MGAQVSSYFIMLYFHFTQKKHRELVLRSKISQFIIYNQDVTVTNIIIKPMKALILFVLLAAALAQVSIPNCKIADLISSTCITCLPNFILQNGACIAQPAPNVSSDAQLASNLNIISNNPELSALLFAYVQNLAASANPILQSNPCTAISNGICQTCSQGYTLVSGSCINTASTVATTTSTSSSSSQAGSATTNTQSQSSSQQTTGSITITTPTSTTTTTSNPTQISTSSSSSQSVVFLPFFSQPSLPGLVTLTSTTSSNYTDPNCKVTNPTFGICIQCYSGFYFSQSNQSCVATNPLCLNVTTNNLCLSCYPGYLLFNGICTIDPNYNIAADDNCKTAVNKICQVCFKGFFLNLTINLCQKANPNCLNITSINTCASCYPGYQLINNDCQPAPLIPQVQLSPNQNSQDTYCAKFVNGSCTVCSQRYYISSSGKCQQVDPFCQNYTQNGICQLCYVGYRLSNAICVVYDPSTPIPPNTQPIQCQYRTVPINGNCKKVSDDCKQWDNTTALCTVCYVGYALNSVGECKREFPQ